MAVADSRDPNDAELFRLLIESVRDYAIFMLDPAGLVTTWNTGAERIKGYTANEIVGRHFSTFYPASDVAASKCEHELQAAIEQGRFEDEGWRVRKDGSQFWANVVISAVRDRSGVLLGFSKVTRDLTDRKRAEHEAIARVAAEQANRAKDEFLAMLGHELRNPLAPIVTALQLMKMRDARSTKEHEVIERQVMYMTRLVDDLLDVSRITRGTIELRREQVDLRQILRKAVEIASPLLERREHHLSIDLPSDEITVYADDARLTQVFANLLTNAAKYTNRNGQIGVRAAVIDAQAVIEVHDDGIGIDAQLLPRVFELFVHGTQAGDRSAGGLGLGLTVVRTLIAQHGGTVEARSGGSGMGSTFVVTLPTERRTPQAVGTGRIRQLEKAATVRRVLIVDDNEDARELLAELLGNIGHQVQMAGDPITALAVAKTFKPEVAILDLGLPVMDGYELAARIRADLADGAPRMLALTGYGQQHDRDRCLEAGFAEHFVKPVDIQRLILCIATTEA